MDRIIVTIDGPAGTGKSSVARELARRLGFAYLDTGAMYRGLTAVCLDDGVDMASPEAVAAKAKRIAMRYDWRSDPPRMEVDSRDVTSRLRDADVGRHVSDVAQVPQVRQVLVAAQRRIAEQVGRLVTDGRDQGSVVFPDAAAKFFLDAAPHVRAKRRYEQLVRLGRHADEAAILRTMERRDTRDVTRPDGPLVCADDAQRVDTSDLTFEQVLDQVEQGARELLGPALNTAPSVENSEAPNDDSSRSGPPGPPAGGSSGPSGASGGGASGGSGGGGGGSGGAAIGWQAGVHDV